MLRNWGIYKNRQTIAGIENVFLRYRVLNAIFVFKNVFRYKRNLVYVYFTYILAFRT